MPDQQVGRELTLTSRRVALESPDVADAVAQAVRVAFGAVSLGLAVALRTLEEASPGAVTPGRRLPISDAADLVVGTAWGAAMLTGRVATTGARVAAPVVSFAFRPPLVPRRFQPGHGLALMVNRWQRDRPGTSRAFGRWSSGAVPDALEVLLSQVDVQRLVTVVLDSIDLDLLVTNVVRRLDVDKVASAALDQLDLTQLVLDRVDLGRVIDEALQRVDLNEVVMEQVDLVGVAEYVVAAIDLPEIIRASTGSVASEAVRGLRMQGVDADLAVARVVDRLLFRRGNRREPVEVPAQADAAAQDADAGIPTGRQP
jgi:hypothetical protein